MRLTHFIPACTIIFIGVSAFSTIAFSALANTSAQSDSSLDASRKSELMHILKQDCGSCHGMTMKGGLGPALLPKNINHKPVLLLENTIYYGRPGTAMPPWQGILTKEEVTWLTQQLLKGIEDDK